MRILITLFQSLYKVCWFPQADQYDCNWGKLKAFLNSHFRFHIKIFRPSFWIYAESMLTQFLSLFRQVGNWGINCFSLQWIWAVQLSAYYWVILFSDATNAKLNINIYSPSVPENSILRTISRSIFLLMKIDYFLSSSRH